MHEAQPIASHPIEWLSARSVNRELLSTPRRGHGSGRCRGAPCRSTATPGGGDHSSTSRCRVPSLHRHHPRLGPSHALPGVDRPPTCGSCNGTISTTTLQGTTRLYLSLYHWDCPARCYSRHAAVRPHRRPHGGGLVPRADRTRQLRPAGLPFRKVTGRRALRRRRGPCRAAPRGCTMGRWYLGPAMSDVGQACGKR